MQNKVLILGAKGRFGLCAAKAFAAAGWQVVGHLRAGANVPAEVADDPRMQWIAVDYRDALALAQAAQGATVVVHAMNPAYTQRAWREEVLPMGDAAIEVARRLQATLLLPGNVYNFGSRMPALLHEDTPQNADTVKGRIRIALEQRLAESGVRSIVIRAGDFFGGGTGTWFDQAMVKDIAKGVFSYPGSLDVPTAWAYLPDLARTFVAVADKRAVLPEFATLNFAGHQISGRQWLELLQPHAMQQGWTRGATTLRVKTLPWGVIRWLVWAVPTFGALLEMKYLWDRPYALANGALTALIGPEPQTALPIASERTLVDLGLMTAAPLSAATAGVAP